MSASDLVDGLVQGRRSVAAANGRARRSVEEGRVWRSVAEGRAGGRITLDPAADWISAFEKNLGLQNLYNNIIKVRWVLYYTCMIFVYIEYKSSAIFLLLCLYF